MNEPRQDLSPDLLGGRESQSRQASTGGRGGKIPLGVECRAEAVHYEEIDLTGIESLYSAKYLSLIDVKRGSIKEANAGKVAIEGLRLASGLAALLIVVAGLMTGFGSIEAGVRFVSVTRELFEVLGKFVLLAYGPVLLYYFLSWWGGWKR